MAMMRRSRISTPYSSGSKRPTTTASFECSKVQNKNRDLVADVKRIQRAGMQVQGGFIVGFDSDRPSIFQRQIDFIQSSGIVTAMVGLLQAPPGTRLFERMRQEGRLLGGMHRRQRRWHHQHLAAHGNARRYGDGYRNIILRRIYSPKQLLRSASARSCANTARPAVRTPLGLQRFLALPQIRFSAGRHRPRARAVLETHGAGRLFRRPRLFGLCRDVGDFRPSLPTRRPQARNAADSLMLPSLLFH
jgi:hypothetical protein